MRNGRRREAGFSYLFVLALVALMGLGLTAAGSLWQTDARRAREAELLFVGTQYRQAIRQYYELEPNQPRLPRTLDDLLLDNRRPSTLRHLRRAYPDPVTGGPFELVRSPDGQGILGVHSPSTATPLKIGGFAPDNAGFAEATTYAEWVFLFRPPPAPATGAAAGRADSPPDAGAPVPPPAD